MLAGLTQNNSVGSEKCVYAAHRTDKRDAGNEPYLHEMSVPRTIIGPVEKYPHAVGFEPILSVTCWCSAMSAGYQTSTFHVAIEFEVGSSCPVPLGLGFSCWLQMEPQMSNQ